MASSLQPPHHDPLQSTSCSSSLSGTTPCLKLCYLGRAKLLSVSLSQLTFSQLLSLVAEAFPGIKSGQIESGRTDSAPRSPNPHHINTASCHIELSYIDEDGDSVVIDSDVSLQLAALSFQESHKNVIKLYIDAHRQTNNLPCRHFQAGSCRYGSSCKFLHQATRRNDLSSDESGSLSDESMIDDEWLMAQMSASEHDNISYLSSPEGYDGLMHVLNNSNLPQIVIHQLVRLLTRPLFRTSTKFRTRFLKQATDKIYNALVGSQFLVALPSHICTNVKSIRGCIEPYVFLCEEIVERTSNGWKEVPLDELKTVVDEVENDPAGELSRIMVRLIDHRAEKKSSEAAEEQMGALTLVSNFRNLPIIPCKEKLLSQENPYPLPTNHVGLGYPSVAAYLDMHFRLMQEAYTATLRDGIHELRKNSEDPNLHAYTNVRFTSIACGTEGVVFRVSFKVKVSHVDWWSAKRLMRGSLLCMSCDKFQTFLWAVVANRTSQHLTRNMVDIRLLEDSNQATLKASSIYMMAETSAASFEAYSYVLRNLQRPEMDNLPFQEHLISLEPHVKEPVYLKERSREDVYDFECAFPLMKQALLGTQFRILMQTWPEWPSSLDKSQMSALKHGLTKRLALIQGPPGTGKSFIGLLIVRIMLSNLKHTSPPHQKTGEPPQEDPVGGPIVIICYTDHALDQFLEGIYTHEKNVVRVGGGSKCSGLEACDLQKLLCEGSHNFFPHDLHEKNREAYSSKKDLEKDILQCVDLVNKGYVTEESLHGIATEEQVQSLFYEGCNIDSVVGMWLHEEERENQMNSNVELHSGRGQATSSTYNPFDTRAIEEELSHALGESTSQIQECHGSENTGTMEEAWTEVGTKMPKLKSLKRHTNVWSLDGQARRMLHAYWIHTIRHEAQGKMTRLSSQYEEACKKKQEIESEMQLSIMRSANVVGMTTTAAAQHHSILECLKAEIVIVEEAAEVPESHILACITASTKHLILIGDHSQLCPSVAADKLAVKHQLNISLFERLIKNGVEYVTLEVQQRMRPSISKLISSIYPMLQDHASVSTHENIKGIKSNVFFFHHTTPEEHRGNDELGNVNVGEAKLVVNLCDYLLKQGYTHRDITILSIYRGQIEEIIRRLATKVQVNDLLPEENQQQLPRVSSVDDYEGEECNIIILSLVRSNCLTTAGIPGFLAESNRVCVALSRARNGLYIFGNGELFSQNSELWGSVVNELQKSGSYGDALILACQNHPDRETKIQKLVDFQRVLYGGCNKPCEHQLICGHVCPKQCHQGGHDKIVCAKRCPHKLPLCNHQCQSLCHGFDKCPPCHELVVKQQPQCGHSAHVQCSNSIESMVCEEPCPKLLACSHECRSTCGRTCTSPCKQWVEKVLPCGHSVKIACHINPSTYLCPQPCHQTLPDCEHACQGTCGTCKQGNEHVPCQQQCNRVLPCGHLCSSLCHKVCPPCVFPCQKSCPHSWCTRKCGYPCVPCMEPCVWACRHQVCGQLCHELCDRPCCNEPCEKFLVCGHHCLGLCGEPCPPICRICTPDFKDTISQMVMEDFDESNRFVKLQDCGHVFESSGLDNWMQTEQAESGINVISPKQCPKCRRPITRSLRYGNRVKAKLCQIEGIKKRIQEIEMTNEGIRHLQEAHIEGAVETFVSAIEKYESNFEAYFALGSVLCFHSKFEEGINLFQFVVMHSPLASALNNVENLKQPMTIEGVPYAQRWMEKLGAIVENTASCTLLSGSKANKQLAIMALVQWASALSDMGCFPAAIKVCNIVMKEEPSNKKAKQTLTRARKRKKSHMALVEVMMMEEVGQRGHWYQCPNGHYYVVGECSGLMQVSVCPDCKSD